jgi:hypothetical protein
MSFLMSDILTTIRNLAVNELGDLADDETSQNEAIYRFVNVVLDKRARQAYIEEFSDALLLAGDNDYTFLKSTVAITDLYEPLGLHATTKYGSTILRRSSFEADMGWIREADNQPINIRGITGLHVLKYLRYPRQVTASGDTIEFPRAAKWDLIFDVVALCKLPKNMYDEFGVIKKEATGTATVKAAINAKGSNSTPPSLLDREV